MHRDYIGMNLSDMNLIYIGYSFFQHAYMSLQGGHIANLYSEVCKSAEVGAPSFTPAVSFLNGAGKSNVVSQCEQVEGELIALLNQRRAALRACLDTILSYSSIVNQVFGHLEPS